MWDVQLTPGRLMRTRHTTHTRRGCRALTGGCEGLLDLLHLHDVRLSRVEQLRQEGGERDLARDGSHCRSYFQALEDVLVSPLRLDERLDREDQGERARELLL